MLHSVEFQQTTINLKSFNKQHPIYLVEDHHLMA